MSLEFSRIKEYGVNLVSRSLGIEYFRLFREGGKLEKALGLEAPPRLLDTVFGAGLGALFFFGSNTLRTLLIWASLDSAPIQEKPRFPKRSFLPAVATDFAPFALIPVSPLFLLTKPLLNIAGNVIGDIVERRLLGGDKLPEASEGVYSSLEDAYNRFYEADYGAGIIRDPEGKVLGAIFEEIVCPIGDSCLELRTVSSHGNFWQEATHITRGNRIVNTFSFTSTEVLIGEESIRKVDDLIKVLPLP